MPRASRSWSMPRRGSNAAIRTCSAPPSSTASRWVFTSRRSWCAMRGRTASKFCAADVNFSDWDCTLEARQTNGKARRAARFPHHRRACGKGAGKTHRRARQRFFLDRAARGHRRRVALHHRAAGRSRRVPLARARPPRRIVGGAPPRRDRHQHGAARRRPHFPSKVREGARPAAAARAAFERRAFPRTGGGAAGDAALRARGRGLRGDRPVAEGASRGLLPRPPRRTRRAAQRGPARRSNCGRTQRSPSPASSWCGNGRAPPRASCS